MLWGVFSLFVITDISGKPQVAWGLPLVTLQLEVRCERLFLPHSPRSEKFWPLLFLMFCSISWVQGGKKLKLVSLLCIYFYLTFSLPHFEKKMWGSFLCMIFFLDEKLFSVVYSDSGGITLRVACLALSVLETNLKMFICLFYEIIIFLFPANLKTSTFLCQVIAVFSGPSGKSLHGCGALSSKSQWGRVWRVCFPFVFHFLFLQELN